MLRNSTKLQHSANTASNGKGWACEREPPVRMLETVPGQRVDVIRSGNEREHFGGCCIRDAAVSTGKKQASAKSSRKIGAFCFVSDLH